MSNLHKHAKICWGTDVVQDAIDSKAGLGVADIWKGLVAAKKLNDRTLMAMFERQGKSEVRFSVMQYTYEQTWLVTR